MNPCVDYSGWTMALTYSGIREPSAENLVYIKLVESDPLTWVDYLIAETPFDQYLRTPSVDMVSAGKLLCAYTTYDVATRDVFINVCEVESLYSPVTFNVNPLLDMYPAGTVNDGAQGFIYPELVYRNNNFGSLIGVAVWTQFEDGIFESPVVPNRAFGLLDKAQFIIDGDYL